MYRTLFYALVLSVLFIFGCTWSQDVKDAWKYTSRQYRTYLNTPAELDLEDKGSAEEYEKALAQSVLPIDLQLASLLRTMENSANKVSSEWVMNTMQRYPWLSGIALVDGQGEIISRYPEHMMKPFDVTPLLERDTKQHLMALRSYVHETGLGPEIYVGHPVYIDEELRGMVVVFFDIRSLLSFSPDPGKMMIASPYGVLWSGNYDALENPVGTADWPEILKHDARGFLRDSTSEFFWMSRYLGNMPLVYAMPVYEIASQEHLEDLPPADVPPMELKGKGLAPGEVGDVGAPTVAPAAPETVQQAPQVETVPLGE